jgi:hypothetical protein
MTQQLDENQLLELLELAKIAEQKMIESSSNLTTLAEKWHKKAEISRKTIHK